MPQKTPRWQSRFGFYLIAVGSAFGLGNLWRFPYIVGENGGGAFVIIYIILSMSIGCALLIAELMLGKMMGSSVLYATQKISKKLPWSKWTGRICLLLSIMVLSYYSVISGWVLHFITQFSIHTMKGTGPLSELSENSLSLLLSNGWLQFLLASVHILVTVVVVAKGVHEGLEKWLSRIMPVFAFLVLILVLRALSLPTTGDVLRFLFYPDFSKLTLSSLAHAIGHVCFTLSIGFGTIVTFGSYLKEDVHLPSIGFKVTVLDTVISLVAALLLFPIAFQSSSRPLTDPMLLFEALPKFFDQMRGGVFFGFVFFLCLWFAALNASIGLLETIVANVKDFKPQMNRTLLTWGCGLFALFLTVVPALSGTVFKSLRIFDLSMIQFIDVVVINWLLPISALALGYVFYKYYSQEELKENFVDTKKIESVRLFSDWNFVIKYLAPGLIILGFILQILKMFLS